MKACPEMYSDEAGFLSHNQCLNPNRETKPGPAPATIFYESLVYRTHPHIRDELLKVARLNIKYNVFCHWPSHLILKMLKV